MIETAPGKKRRIIFVITIILVSFAFLSWISWQWEQGTRQSERHDYTHSIEISCDMAIEDMTLLLPVPEPNGTPVIAEYLVNRTGYGVPADWDLSIREENGTPMLAIRAARMVPDDHAYPVPIEPGVSPIPTTLQPGTEYSSETPVLVPVYLAVMVSGNKTIDTRDPLGKEPVFDPDNRFTPGTATPPAYRGSIYIHTVPVYVQYTSARSVTLSLRTSIQGVNSIWRGGWVFNSYSDTVSLEVQNGTQGWVEGEGTLLTGEGVYY